MKENENSLRKMISCCMISAEYTEIREEDVELYLFMRGGFAAK